MTQNMEEFIKENGLCSICAGAGDVWNGDPESEPPPCEHCGGNGKEPEEAQAGTEAQ
jgi:DnaJ-class molecular chaperone